jgi:hypothetical protein
MTSDCPDDLCKRKIQAIDRAIGHNKNVWVILLNWTNSNDDVAQALRFCEVFQLESKMSVKSNGYEVLIRDDLERIT